MVILYTEISFFIAFRVLFPNTNKTIFLYILENYYHS